MEGYLLVRQKALLTGGVKWTRRWYVLSTNNTLTCYENYDLTSCKTKNEISSIDLAFEAWGVQTVTQKGMDLCFILKSKTKTDSIYLSAPNERELHLWLGEIYQSMRAKNPSVFDYTVKDGSFYHTLELHRELEKNKVLNADILIRAFRKKYNNIVDEGWAKNHQETTVQEAVFNLKKSFNALSKRHFGTLLQKSNYKFMKFEAVVTKKVIPNGGTRMGFSIAESPLWNNCLEIVSIDSDINVSTNLDTRHNQDGHSLEIGDEIVKIGGERVVGWPIARVMQRLNGFHMPGSNSIIIEFSRKEEINPFGGNNRTDVTGRSEEIRHEISKIECYSEPFIFFSDLNEYKNDHEGSVAQRQYAIGGSNKTTVGGMLSFFTSNNKDQAKDTQDIQDLKDGEVLRSPTRASLGDMRGSFSADTTKNFFSEHYDDDNNNTTENDNEKEEGEGGSNDASNTPSTSVQAPLVSPTRRTSIQSSEELVHTLRQELDDTRADLFDAQRQLKKKQDHCKKLETDFYQSQEDLKDMSNRLSISRSTELVLNDHIKELSEEIESLRMGIDPKAGQYNATSTSDSNASSPFHGHEKVNYNNMPTTSMSIAQKMARMKERYATN